MNRSRTGASRLASCFEICASRRNVSVKSAWLACIVSSSMLASRHRSRVRALYRASRASHVRSAGPKRSGNVASTACASSTARSRARIVVGDAVLQADQRQAAPARGNSSSSARRAAASGMHSGRSYPSGCRCGSRRTRRRSRTGRSRSSRRGSTCCRCSSRRGRTRRLATARRGRPCAASRLRAARGTDRRRGGNPIEAVDHVIGELAQQVGAIVREEVLEVAEAHEALRHARDDGRRLDLSRTTGWSEPITVSARVVGMPR